MRGYVARKGDRWYAVVYEGLDPVTGRDKRSWHPAGTTREEAEKLAARLAAELNGRNDKVRSLTLGVYLTNTWLPGKKINLAESTWDGYRRRSNGTSSPPSANYGSDGSVPTISRRSTTGCCTPPTEAGHWRRRRCSRCISSSEVPSTMP